MAIAGPSLEGAAEERGALWLGAGGSGRAATSGGGTEGSLGLERRICFDLVTRYGAPANWYTKPTP